jgi:hypothetical protein
MSVGRRCLLLPLAYLSLAYLFAHAGSARAQFGRQDSHELWNNTLTPAQIKEALDKLLIGDETDPFQKMLRDHLQKQYPGIPPAFLDAAIKKAVSDPKFLEQAKQLAKEKQAEPGRMPKLNQDDLARLAKMLPRGTEPGKLPPDPKQPIDGKATTDIPPPINKKGTTTPNTPKSVEPQPSDPVIPNKDLFPKGTERPFPPPNLNPPTVPLSRPAEDALFSPPDEAADPRTKSMQAFAAIWERNLGPLDQTPEVRKALFDLASNTNGLDFDLQDGKGNSIWDLLKNGDGNGLSFGDFDAAGGNWKLPNFDFPSFKLGNWGGGSSGGGGGSSSSWSWGNSPPRPRPGSPSSGGGSGGFGNFGFGGSWFPVIVLGVVVLGILLWVLVKNLRQGTPELAYVGDGLGPWPVDPRRINTREDVVKAFEYLSVLICGPSAKTWTHNTIADALSELAATHGETAAMLARLYELARYAPLDEPLTHDEVMEARELVCGLAGVSY